MNISLKGKLKLTTIEAATGRIISVDEGDNLVLRSGVNSLANLLTGFTRLPYPTATGGIATDPTLLPGQRLIDINGPVSDIVKYVQFGRGSSSPTYDDVSSYSNGTLDPNSVSPSGASPIVPVTAVIGLDNTVTFTCQLTKDQGNITPGGDTVYTEAVLMGRSSENPIVYKWFARRVFSGRAKNSSVILKADWSMVFSVQEQLS